MSTTFADRLLAWYDEAARDLPWRVSPADRAQGMKPDAYRVWLSEIMLQQTTVATVTPRFQTFLAKWPTVQDLAATPLEEVLGEWAGLGYYARARNLHKCAVYVAEELNGVFPDTEEALCALPGIGPYTSAAIAAIAFDRPAVVVDGNVDRVIVRHDALLAPIKEVKQEIREGATARTPSTRPGDYAQAMMDLGATVCTPKAPRCDLCPVQKGCNAFHQGIAGDLPTKPARKTKPTRHGIVFLGRRADGAILCERRPDKGLLGGMLGLPGSDWTEKVPTSAESPAGTTWQAIGEVRHTFTHFHLVLSVQSGSLKTTPTGYEWLAADRADELPTLFRKCVELADVPALPLAGR